MMLFTTGLKAYFRAAINVCIGGTLLWLVVNCGGSPKYCNYSEATHSPKIDIF